MFINAKQDLQNTGNKGRIAKHGREGRDSKTQDMREGKQNMGEEGGIEKHKR
jgi:hypothetical protein